MKRIYYSLLFILFVLILIFVFYIINTVEADKQMKVIIDRFEGDYAVVELPDKTLVDMPRKLLETEAKEGDIIEIKALDVAARVRKKNVNKLLNEVFEK